MHAARGRSLADRKGRFRPRARTDRRTGFLRPCRPAAHRQRNRDAKSMPCSECWSSLMTRSSFFCRAALSSFVRTVVAHGRRQDADNFEIMTICRPIAPLCGASKTAARQRERCADSHSCARARKGQHVAAATPDDGRARRHHNAEFAAGVANIVATCAIRRTDARHILAQTIVTSTGDVPLVSGPQRAPFSVTVSG